MRFRRKTNRTINLCSAESSEQAVLAKAFSRRATQVRSSQMPKEREMNMGAVHYKTCPTCKKKALVKSCAVCRGTGQVTVSSPGQWSGPEVRRNPYLPYMASPPPVIRQVKCSSCGGRGWFLFCLHCHGVAPQKRVSSPDIPRQKLSTASTPTSVGHCPKCGFSYMWDGHSCGHCGYLR